MLSIENIRRIKASHEDSSTALIRTNDEVVISGDHWGCNLQICAGSEPSDILAAHAFGFSTVSYSEGMISKGQLQALKPEIYAILEHAHNVAKEGIIPFVISFGYTQAGELDDIRKYVKRVLEENCSEAVQDVGWSPELLGSLTMLHFNSFLTVSRDLKHFDAEVCRTDDSVTVTLHMFDDSRKKDREITFNIPFNAIEADSKLEDFMHTKEKVCL